MDIRGTKTQENLLRAFNVESEAKNKYEIYAAKAKKDGFLTNSSASSMQTRVYTTIVNE